MGPVWGSSFPQEIARMPYVMSELTAASARNDGRRWEGAGRGRAGNQVWLRFTIYEERGPGPVQQEGLLPPSVRGDRGLGPRRCRAGAGAGVGPVPGRASRLWTRVCPASPPGACRSTVSARAA